MDKLEKINKELDWIQRLNDLIKERLDHYKEESAKAEREKQ